MECKGNLSEISNDKLLRAFEELQVLKSTGVLTNGKIKEVWNECKNLYQVNFSLDFIQKEIYYEMAKRYYDEIGAGKDKEMKKKKIIFSKPGGNASKNSNSARLLLPAEWVKEMGFTQEDRLVNMSFDGEKIEISK